MSFIDNPVELAPAVMGALAKVTPALEGGGLDPKLLCLVQMRTSQINGCAFCLQLHLLEAQAYGESVERLMGVAAWRESPWYSPQERAALALTESLTRIADGSLPDAIRSTLRDHFSDREIVFLTSAIAILNAYNRMNVVFETSPERAKDVYMRRKELGETALHKCSFAGAFLQNTQQSITTGAVRGS